MNLSTLLTRSAPLLELRHVSKRFIKPPDYIAKFIHLMTRPLSGQVLREEIVYAVDDVSLTIDHGEVVGLVGESGCGKSTLGRIAAGLYSVSSGQRLWQGEDLDLAPTNQPKHKSAKARMRSERLAIQMIFQDAYAALNPRMRVLDMISEAPVVHHIISGRERQAYAIDLLQRVGLSRDMLYQFPHQLSGGQRARIGIARALAVKPQFLICDEAVAALDVSIQAQVLNLFIQLREALELAYLFISHNLSVVRHVSDRVLIMYLGRIVEAAPTEAVFTRANHPYTQALLACAPKLEVGKIAYIPIHSEVPSPLQPPSGCHFHPRCPYAMPRCSVETPLLKEVAPHHFSACHLNDKI